MANSFEKVMQACLESKKAPAKKTVNEKKGTPAKKRIAESAKRPSTKKLHESDDPEVEADVDVAIDDVVVDDDVMDDVADDIVVVVDPELDAEDVDSITAELQDIVDGTPEGEVPTLDDYVGDYTYSCPICGTAFFSETEMAAGDECPVCGEVPEAFVLDGQVASTEEGTEDEEIPAEDLEVDIPEEDLEVDVPDEAAEECKKRESKRMRTGYTGYQLDESTFNPFLTKFIKENYKNAKSFAMKSATLSAKKTLKIECVITMKSGAKKTAVLAVEGFDPRKKILLAKDASGTFKAEGKVAPFKFAVKTTGKTITCEGLKYNFTTKAIKEGARLQISGNLIRESAQKRNFQKGRRK